MGIFSFFKDILKEDYEDIDQYIENINNGNVDVRSEFWGNDNDENLNINKINLRKFTDEQINEYVSQQCEIMEESTRIVDESMMEYSRVTEKFADVEIFEGCPDVLKYQIADVAEKVDNLSNDRNLNAPTESKLSNNTYRRLERLEDEIVPKCKYIREQENYYEAVRRDMQMLEGERMALRLEAKHLGKRQKTIKKAAYLCIFCLALVFSVFAIAMVAVGTEENSQLFLIVTVLSAFLALGMCAMLFSTRRDVKLVEIKLNKATVVLNKLKIKFVNVSNVLDYEYRKFDIKNADELERKYEVYQQMKEEQKKALRLTAHLNESEKELLTLLNRIGISDCNVWLTNVRALYDRKEMVEVRHDLSMRRQKLRESIEYNEKKFDEAKANIRDVIAVHPRSAQQIYDILDRFEKRNS